MIRSFTLALVSAAVLAACAPEIEAVTESTEAPAINEVLAEVLAAELRVEDKARDTFRHPAETLAFFQVEPTHTVIEYAPGGGWYTRVLAPYVQETGSYIAVGFPPEAAASISADFVEVVREGGETFSARQSEALSLPAEKLPFHFSNVFPEELIGTVDRVLMIRMMHNLQRWGIADSEIETLHAALKPDGLFGVVQHRAKADATDEFADGNRGYLREIDLIAFFESKGFELVDSSEVNANPNDPTDHENGVWALPPSFAGGDEDREAFASIGESDRMTLLFKKAD